MRPVLVLSTVGRDFDAAALAQELVELRLVACVNIVPGLHSVYRWKGAVERDDEQLLVMKTTEERVAELERALVERHPYDVPEFVVVAISHVAEAYGAWMIESAKREP